MLDSARHQWEEGRRRLDAEGEDTARSRHLWLLVEAVLDNLRRRVGQTFTLAELAGAYEGKGRYLVPVFTLLLPIAAALAAAKTSTKVVVLTFVACLSALYGTFLTLAWTYSP